MSSETSSTAASDPYIFVRLRSERAGLALGAADIEALSNRSGAASIAIVASPRQRVAKLFDPALRPKPDHGQGIVDLGRS